MKVCIYRGGMKLIRKSGIGQAILHQEQMLKESDVTVLPYLTPDTDIIHINTILPDAVLVALYARMHDIKVIYYGHSTKEDFKNSFKGSNYLSAFFQTWIRFCYGLGNCIVTPTLYARRQLSNSGIKKDIFTVSNGVDTAFFHPSSAAGLRFRKRYALAKSAPVVISVGHFMERKGLSDFIAMAKQMPTAHFFWFGYTDPILQTEAVKNAMRNAPANITFPGYVSQSELHEAYCGCDLFAFMSYEETEGIVVLEALSCGTPTLVRDIPVYADWLIDGKNVYKAHDQAEFIQRTEAILTGKLPSLQSAEIKTARQHSLRCEYIAMRKIYTDLLSDGAN